MENPKVGNVVIEDVEKIDGEARANNRKGKLIFFYEWEIVLKWKGHVNGNDKEITGKIEIPNIPCHSVNNERAVKDTSQASLAAIGYEKTHAHILNLNENRDRIRTRHTKSDFISKKRKT